MTEVETELDSRYDDIDVDSILARCERRGPLTFSRKRSLYQAPEFIKRLPSTEEVEEGTTITFACKVVGFPEPTITWYKDDDVIEPDSRAKLDSEDSGIHSIKIADVSKCDAGIYKIHASNLEARSKMRNRKKPKRNRTVACAPNFPAIIERTAEEQKETLEVALQPDSPLTPLYCTISRKAPVMWPAFLGDWAYNADDVLNRNEIEDLGSGYEDVFDSDSDEPTLGITFVSAAYAQLNEELNDNSAIEDISKTLDTEIDKEIKANGYVVSKRKEVNHNWEKDFENDNNNERYNYMQGNGKQDFDNADIKCNNLVCDKLNNNAKLDDSDYGYIESTGSVNTNATPVCQTEHKSVYSDPDNVSVISVHRSYAKGDSTSSVARRSPSPYSRSRNHMTFGRREIGMDTSQHNETTTLQNLSNERILHRMTQNISYYQLFWRHFRSFALICNVEDYLWELCLLICGGTFLALCLDLPPSTFVIDIVIVLLIKLVLTYVLSET